VPATRKCNDDDRILTQYGVPTLVSDDVYRVFRWTGRTGPKFMHGASNEEGDGAKAASELTGSERVELGGLQVVGCFRSNCFEPLRVWRLSELSIVRRRVPQRSVTRKDERKCQENSTVWYNLKKMRSLDPWIHLRAKFRP
jgi:hypothetical protein